MRTRVFGRALFQRQLRREKQIECPGSLAGAEAQGDAVFLRLDLGSAQVKCVRGALLGWASGAGMRWDEFFQNKRR